MPYCSSQAYASPSSRLMLHQQLASHLYVQDRPDQGSISMHAQVFALIVSKGLMLCCMFGTSHTL